LDVSAIPILLLSNSKFVTNLSFLIFRFFKGSVRVFDKGPEPKCEFNGCQKTLQLKWRVEKLQYYYYCYGDSAVIDSVEGTGHSTVKKQSITRGSIFFNKKIGPQLLLSIFEKFFTGARLNDILLNHKINSVTVSQLFFDCQMLMLSDYERYNLDPPLGSDPR
jgi:hypothetical protein